MSKEERRRKYNAQTVLIDSSRILSTTFDDGDLYFTGPQIELMRNLMQYANRIESYVAEYESSYYFTPDNDDWDEIQAIVADMEETLMGNPNTLWGFGQELREAEQDTNALVGENVLYSDAVETGVVWVVQSVTAWDATSIITDIRLIVSDGVADSTLVYSMVSAIGQHVYCLPGVSLVEGDKVAAVFRGVVAGDTIRLRIWGYKMAVP